MTGIAFLVWAEIDTILMVVDIHRAFRKARALDAARSFVNDAVRLAHIGQAIFDASVVINESMGETDAVSVAATERALRVISEQQARFRHGADVLLNQLGSRDLDQVEQFLCRIGR